MKLKVSPRKAAKELNKLVKTGAKFITLNHENRTEFITDPYAEIYSNFDEFEELLRTNTTKRHTHSSPDNTT